VRPLSYTKNLGGFPKAYHAIRRGYAPGVTVDQFRAKCGLNADGSLLVAEFFLFTRVQSGQEIVVGDTLVTQTCTRPAFDLTLARLYFFALNLAMPGERLSTEQREAGQLQRLVITQHIYVQNGWVHDKFDKISSLEPFLHRAKAFRSAHKWVTNYWFMKEQCQFVVRPNGTLETFPDTWGLLAMRLFFDRYTTLYPTDDVGALVAAAYEAELHKLIGVPQFWLDERVEGAADMFLKEEFYVFDAPLENTVERKAAQKGKPLPTPTPGTEAARRLANVKQLVRRGDNRKFIQQLYSGTCQLSGVVLRVPDEKFTVDCAHIRPLGSPHNGPDDVSNMLSLSPTMHRLLDRRCLRIDPNNLTITLLHRNDVTHLPKIFLKPEHRLSAEHLHYYNSCLSSR
jgi:hypothetical protein